MAKKIRTVYYSRLLRMNGLIIALAILFFMVIACISVGSSRKKAYLESYNLALHDIEVKFEEKNSSFYELLFSLFGSQYGEQPLSAFLAEGDDNALLKDYAFTQQLLQQFRLAAIQDTDVRAILIYKSINDTFLTYSASTNVLLQEDNNFPYYAELRGDAPRRKTLGAQQLKTSAGREKSFYDVQVYSILSTYLGMNSQIPQNSGVAVCYDVTPYHQLLANRGLQPEARFLLVTLDGTVIFDSFSEYAEQGYTEYPLSEALLSEGESVTLEGRRYLKSVSIDRDRGYAALYYLPEAPLYAHLFREILPIALIALLFIGLILALLSISTHLFSRRMRQLEHGMAQIGKSRLSYRIPSRSGNDEFTQIAGKFNEMCDDLQEQINQKYLYQIREQEAEFYALQVMINPHFLYNTLEAVRERLYEQGSEDAADMIVLLSRLFDYQIHGSDFVTLGEELECLRIYMDFFSLRYDGRFLYQFDLPNELLRCAIPKLSFQPIMENYFIHGLLPGEDNEVSLRAAEEGRHIRVIFTDNGQGISPEKLGQLRGELAHGLDQRKHLGLANVHERLRIAFGGDCGVEVYSEGEGRGTRVELLIDRLTVAELEAKRKHL